MGEVVGRKKKAVAAGALALTLGAGLGLGAVAWGSEGAAPEESVRFGDAWALLVGKKLEEKAAAVARSHRAEVQQALSAYRASEAVEREAATEAGEQTLAEAAGAQDAHLSAEGPGTSSGEAAGACSEEADRADERCDSQEVPKESGSAGEGAGFASRPSASGPEPSEGASAEGGSVASGETPSDEGSGAADSIAPGTLVVGGVAIPYRDVRGGTTPSSGGGLWLGSDAVDDGSWGYFVGHNPGSFAPVRSLSLGDAVAVCDRSGGQHTYTVRNVFQVEETATWKTIASRVTGYGESVVLQTCAGDGMNVIVVAA